MKKLSIFLVLLLVAFCATAAPTLVVLYEGGDSVWPQTSLFKLTATKFAKDYPDVKLEWLKVDLADGSTLTMDARIAAGQPPNIYIGTAVRVTKYMIPEFALPLDGLVRDLDKYIPGVLDPFRRNGKLLAIPQPGSGQGMCINLDIMKDIGYTMPANWTIADFLKMAELVKQKYGGKKWATGMFAGNQSGDYLLNNWFAAFGVKFYSDTSYNRSVIADTGGAKVYAFYQDLVRAGYVPPSAATLNDDDYAAEWAAGKFAATAFFAGWTDGYFKTALDQGIISKRFDFTFVPFPHAPGVEKVPTYYNGAILIVHKTGTDMDKVAARFIEYFNSAECQSNMAFYGNVSTTRTDTTMKSANPHMIEIDKIVAAGGIQDVGLTDPRFTERRALQYPILQRVLNLTVTPEKAIAEYQAALSAVK